MDEGPLHQVGPGLERRRADCRAAALRVRPPDRPGLKSTCPARSPRWHGGSYGSSRAHRERRRGPPWPSARCSPTRRRTPGSASPASSAGAAWARSTSPRRWAPARPSRSRPSSSGARPRPEGRDPHAVRERGARRLRHRNLVEVFASGVRPDGIIFMVMEHLRGMTLRELHEGARPHPHPVVALHRARHRARAHGRPRARGPPRRQAGERPPRHRRGGPPPRPRPGEVEALGAEAHDERRTARHADAHGARGARRRRRRSMDGRTSGRSASCSTSCSRAATPSRCAACPPRTPTRWPATSSGRRTSRCGTSRRSARRRSRASSTGCSRRTRAAGPRRRRSSWRRSWTSSRAFAREHGTAPPFELLVARVFPGAPGGKPDLSHLQTTAPLGQKAARAQPAALPYLRTAEMPVCATPAEPARSSEPEPPRVSDVYLKRTALAGDVPATLRDALPPPSLPATPRGKRAASDPPDGRGDRAEPLPWASSGPSASLHRSAWIPHLPSGRRAERGDRPPARRRPLTPAGPRARRRRSRRAEPPRRTT